MPSYRLREQFDPEVPEAMSEPVALLDGPALPVATSTQTTLPQHLQKQPQPTRAAVPKVVTPAEKIQRAANVYANAAEAQIKAEADVERLKIALRVAQKTAVDAEGLKEEARSELAALVAAPREKSDVK